MRHWDELLREDRAGFEVVVDKSYEDISPRDLFDDSVTDIDEICRKIDSYDLDWFMLRARVMLDGHELGEHIVGGFLYEDARETLKDGMAEDLIYSAIQEAKTEVLRLRQRLTAIDLEAVA
jgi:hypothetical protein